ncbi:DUF2339 domain-containing protein [Myroides sp. N17-2]|uniref:DUF2339 domain-containing protein n=1 Tax=Myroides sp. N17-2 TaxID=2030799 RepID=UPI000EFD15A8|nr:DUF2339 domain-containing protein [Myroides sp. N17-2]
MEVLSFMLLLGLVILVIIINNKVTEFLEKKKAQNNTLNDLTQATMKMVEQFSKISRTLDSVNTNIEKIANKRAVEYIPTQAPIVEVTEDAHPLPTPMVKSEYEVDSSPIIDIPEQKDESIKIQDNTSSLAPRLLTPISFKTPTINTPKEEETEAVEAINAPNEELVTETVDTIDTAKEEDITEAVEAINAPNEELVTETVDAIDAPKEETITDVVEAINVPNEELVSETVDAIDAPKEETITNVVETVNVSNDELAIEVVDIIDAPKEETIVEAVDAINVSNEESLTEAVETIDTPKEELPIDAINKPAEEPILTTPPPIPQNKPRVEVIASTPNPDDFIEKLKNVNWLNAIGIITLVLGIGFFVKYAIDQEWINEIGRVSLGMVIGAGIIGVAHKMKEKYHAFSSVLVGGGFAIFYITITLAFREYEIFSQLTAFIILIVITLFAILLSINYNRQELAIFAFIGGMLAPLMVSTGQGNYIVLFTYVLLLNTGILVVAIRNNWYVVDKFSFVLTTLYMLTWLTTSHKPEYIVGESIFATLLFIQFMLLILVRYIRTKEDEIDSMQLFYLFTINTVTLYYYFRIFANHDGANYLGVATIFLALLNGIALAILVRLKTKQVDKSINYTLLAITVGLVSLAIPLQLDGIYITVVWAVEIVVLLWIWTKTKVNIFRLGYMIIAILAVISYIIDLTQLGGYMTYLAPDSNLSFKPLKIILNSFTITGLSLLAATIAAYQILRKTNIDEYDTHGIKFISFIDTRTVERVFFYGIYILAFLVPFIELFYQFTVRVELQRTVQYPVMDVRNFILLTYMIIYVASIAYIHRNKQIDKQYYPKLIITGVLTLLYLIQVYTLRNSIYVNENYITSTFGIHILPMIGLAYLYYSLWCSKANIGDDSTKNTVHTVLFYTIVLLCSVQLDNAVVWAFGTSSTYSHILSNVHTIGYPILWGLLSMGIMILGIVQNKAYYRKLSLISFSVIILKFYAYDVWDMSQGGRIASFVLLGLILLIVSFLLERIKRLVKDKESTDNQ